MSLIDFAPEKLPILGANKPVKVYVLNGNYKAMSGNWRGIAPIQAQAFNHVQTLHLQITPQQFHLKDF